MDKSSALGTIFGTIVNNLLTFAFRAWMLWVLWPPIAVEMFHGPALTYWNSIMLMAIMNVVGASFHTPTVKG
jgi:hypothetical protein